MIKYLSLQSYNKRNEKPKKKSEDKKRTPFRMSFFLVISEPSILPKALFKVEHFVLDAL